MRRLLYMDWPLPGLLIFDHVNARDRTGVATRARVNASQLRVRPRPRSEFVPFGKLFG
jgi:hypothetical protein